MLHNINDNILLNYLVLVNLITFAAFGVDKYKAKWNKWRIPESNLIFLSIIGGSAGGILSMLIFKHKTHKMKFKIGMPIILLLQILIFIYFII
ncbi:DUF1294 domain-containing protein [Paratissierella segnis]|uniref:DUF1294 domain-containing protein n=1 Tax=Paratissierella segnis TaxID=2763679 RepID=UPI00223B0BA4|nr:DUF1294 domain-containing protein [Paratissierella segnis]